MFKSIAIDHRTLLQAGLLALLLVFASLHGAHAAIDDVEVLVDMPGDTPEAAREKGVAYAEKRALFLMLYREVPDKAEDIARTFTQEQVRDMIRGYTVVNELFSENRYLAKLRFSFNEAVIDRLLMREPPPDRDYIMPLVILPALDNGKEVKLWESGNFWRSLWNGVALERAAGTLVMPYGDPTDAFIVDPTNVLSRDYETLKPLIERYGAQEAVVVYAQYRLDRKPIAVQVTVRRITPRGLTERDFIYEAETPDDTFEVLLTRASRDLAAQLQEISSGAIAREEYQLQNAKRVRLVAQFRRLSSWVEMKQALDQLPRILKIQMGTITINSADMLIYYDGTEEFLETSLRAAGMGVTRASDHWQIYNE